MKEKKETLESSLKLIVRSSAFVFIALFITKILVYLHKVIIARYFGPEFYGSFSLAVMIVSLFIVIASLGLSEGLLRYVALYRGKNETDKIKYIFRYSIRFLIISSVLLGIILFFSADFISISIFHDSNLALFLKIFSIVVPAGTLAYAILNVIRAYEFVGLYMFVSSVARNGLIVLSLLILMFFGLRWEAVAFSYVIGFLGMLFISYFVFGHKISPLLKKDNGDEKKGAGIFRELLSYSLPLIFSGFLLFLFGWTDTFTIGYLKDTFSVGLYSAAIPIALLLAVVPELFMKLFFPLINREYGKKNLDLIKEISKQLSKWIFAMNLPLLILFVLFPGAGINILFGSEYLPAATALRILAIGFFVSNGASAIALRLISMTGRSKLILLNTIAATGLNIVLNFILVPMQKIWFIDNSIGINGAAIATSISLIFLSGLLILESKYYLSFIPMRRDMLKITLASLIPLALLIYLRSVVDINKASLLVLGALFFLLYGLIFLLLGGLDRNDWMIINQIKNKVKRAKQ